jgi:23S rRNA (uracil1939-C5)-methyltransferase
MSGGGAVGTGSAEQAGDEAGRATTLLRVDRIAGGGDGVGREESGRVVFVPRTVPGDVVRVEIVESKRRWARGRASEFVSRGDSWRSAPCPVYTECGGCRLQHITPEEQRRVKREVVAEALRRIGGLDVAVPELIAGEREFGYRNRVTFSSETADGNFVAGFKRLNDPGALADVRRCLLSEAPIVSAWHAMREAWGDGICEAPPKGESRITIRAAVNGTVDVLIRGDRPLGEDTLAVLFDRVPGLVGWHHVRPGRKSVCLSGRETLADRWQDIEFDLPADVFLQVNREASSLMDRWLEERVGELEGLRVLDLYSGVGARAIRWARAGADVTACEVSERAAAACFNAGTETESRLEVIASRVEGRIADLLPADLVVVNPPRAGLSSGVAEALVSGSAGRLAYVSCDPATLARDLERMKPAWAVVEVQPFDAFPQTAHVETVAWLERI